MVLNTGYDPTSDRLLYIYTVYPISGLAYGIDDSRCFDKQISHAKQACFDEIEL